MEFVIQRVFRGLNARCFYQKLKFCACDLALLTEVLLVTIRPIQTAYEVRQPLVQ
jgi:hypothetical protein